jgi:hypothetical protein
MPIFNRREEPIDHSADELRERRLDEVKALAERFTYDLGLLIAGHRVPLEEYVAPAVAARLRARVEPFLATGDAMRPNFGDYGELRVEGNLTEGRDPIVAYVEFDDMSQRETSAGEVIPMGKRRMLLTLTIEPNVRGVLDVDLRPIAAGG